MALEDAASGVAASLASTGQQKALLIGVVLGHAALLAAARGFAPLLLLDEPTVHLDAGRRAALFATLLRLPAQALLTGADREAFLPLRGQAQAWEVVPGALLADAGFAPPGADASGADGAFTI
jgi:DNA replication and repair protein RecF